MLEGGANIHAKDCRGHTPLHSALLISNILGNVAAQSRADVAMELVYRGANPFIQDLQGKTAPDLMVVDGPHYFRRAFKEKLLEEWCLRRATIGRMIQKAADPKTELLDPAQRRVPKLLPELILQILKQAYPGSRSEPTAEGHESGPLPEDA